MTERLYLADPYLARFKARVVAARELDGRPAVVLDRTAFYPEGGGQPGDRGALGTARVLDTQEQDGEVLHVVEAAVEPGTELQGEVDWARRFDHMQQHHGQHLLSAAFVRVHEAPTVSFHLGERTCTIDLDKPLGRFDDAALRAAERAVNETIWANHEVVARDFTAEERKALPLRKEAVKGDRVVWVQGVDASPCGGTHPRRTGEVGSVAVLRASRWGKDQTRIEFVCGGRVVKLLAEATALLARTAETLKCATGDVGEAVARTAAEAQARRKQADALELELARFETERLLAAGGTGPVVATFSRAPGFARAVASGISARGRIALVAALDEGRAHLVFARPKGDGPNLGAVLKESLALLSGKGGGSPDFAQGSGEPARLDEALAAATRAVAG